MFLVVAANCRVVKGPDTSSVVRIVGVHSKPEQGHPFKTHLFRKGVN